MHTLSSREQCLGSIPGHTATGRGRRGVLIGELSQRKPANRRTAEKFGMVVLGDMKLRKASC